MSVTIEETIRWRRRGLDEPWLPDSFMAALSLDSIRRLECHGRVRNDVDAVRANGDDAAVIVVLNGAVKVYRPYRDGKRSLVHIAGLGDVLNAEPLLTGNDMPAHTVFDLSQHTQVFVVPRTRFRYLLAHDDEITSAVTLSLARRSQEQEVWLGHVGRTVDVRAWAYLVGLARRHGVPLGTGVLLDIGLTQADIAEALGVASSSVEKALRKLRTAGKVSTRYSSVVLHSVPSEADLDRCS